MDENRRRVGKTLCAIDGLYWQIAKLSSVKENMFWLLYALNDGEFHTQKQICEDWLLPKTTVNTLIKECEASGYLTLHSIPGCKRELEIRLTEAGRAYADKALRAADAIEKQAMEETRKNCSPTFIEDLERFAVNLQTAMENFEKSEKE